MIWYDSDNQTKTLSDSAPSDIGQNSYTETNTTLLRFLHNHFKYCVPLMLKYVDFLMFVSRESMFPRTLINIDKNKKYAL
jgi:hypothetical protein